MQKHLDIMCHEVELSMLVGMQPGGNRGACTTTILPFLGPQLDAVVG
jgi:hypothetical protein